MSGKKYHLQLLDTLEEVSLVSSNPSASDVWFRFIISRLRKGVNDEKRGSEFLTLSQIILFSFIKFLMYAHKQSNYFQSFNKLPVDFFFNSI